MSLLSDVWKGVKSVAGGALDVVEATGIGGPVGKLAKSIVAPLLGLDEGATKEQIEAKVAEANPELLLQLRKADAEFRTRLRELDVEVERIYAGDRDSARKREITLKDWMPKVLAFMVVGGYVGLQYYILTQELPAANLNIILRSFGIIEGAVLTVLVYYFGSSAGSARKTEILEKEKK